MAKKKPEKEFEIVYWELTRLSRLVMAPSMEEAVAKSEALRAERMWGDCTEDSDGTHGVERVYLNGEEIYTSGAVAA